ncbi:MAG: KpsF/GutQ family sugar-phosphate isomerase [Candidatus Eisenbacteria bacterium]|uniref:KpsF/GutQ family sugar-phosphate isomerase n=1 Tax=Eiseniibacteriota bacterium TaxID=2212470 RepID=A0A9D6QLV6_UNCEI|nr:KpsF/GutQ family sugar-phosphate isomerase [Candidatus Eisenbacteria bacterium]MBI3539078.1 KpsF/GutQ family sugar-phosphate isomerase [Candidatus Eisenbacteria bacterium]
MAKARAPSRSRASARPADLLALAKQVVRTEAAAVAALEKRLGAEFVEAVDVLASARGKVIVSGVGKSGLIAHKLAATLTSTGTPAVFLHPTDALHGDAGLFTPGDAALFISKSGGSEELIALIQYLERHAIPLVSIIATPRSALAERSRVTLMTGPVREACPMELTPTTSTTVAQVMGDCLAIALLERRGFRAEDFRFLHPGGVIGGVASRRVGELMHAGESVPRVRQTAPLREIMLEIMARRLGITAVVDGKGRLAGVVTDGDFKRILMKHHDPWRLTAASVMSRTPTTVDRDALVATAVRMMESHAPGPITALIVIDEQRRPIGVLHLHDCLRAGG